MKVSQMRKLLKGLPANMEIVMPLGDDAFVTVCAENSAVVELQDDSEDDNNGDVMEVLLLVGCSCKSEYEVEGLNTQPELN